MYSNVDTPAASPVLTDWLETIVEATRRRLAERQRAKPLAEVVREAEAARPTRPFTEALSRSGISVIAEHTRRAPSVPRNFRSDDDVAGLVRAYERGGAAALSILTEQDFFRGSLRDLAVAREVTELPILRKDFLVDPYQLYEARVAGADAVLLMVGLLSDEDVATLFESALDLDLDVLVEVHNTEELETALSLDVDIIGINNRDFDSLESDLARTHKLLVDVPAGKVVVSESGIQTAEDIDELERVGVDAFLIGERLMSAEDPEQMCRSFTGTEEPTQA